MPRFVIYILKIADLTLPQKILKIERLNSIQSLILAVIGNIDGIYFIRRPTIRRVLYILIIKGKC